ncbi:hypothetical protein NIES73_39300 [Sphaerospermopsis kisseleviana NIES-73]|nr:hypothetical protein NIES73_39300 [Sphaerospermopsis kisseleviana NIES-73]
MIFRSCFAIAPHIPKTAIALPHPKKRSHSHTPKSDRPSTSQKAIAPPYPKSDRSPTPQKRSPSHIPKSDRLPHPKTAIAFGKVFKCPLRLTYVIAYTTNINYKSSSTNSAIFMIDFKVPSFKS